MGAVRAKVLGLSVLPCRITRFLFLKRAWLRKKKIWSVWDRGRSRLDTITYLILAFLHLPLGRLQFHHNFPLYTTLCFVDSTGMAGGSAYLTTF